MTDEPFWDELGIAWQAITPALEVHPDRLQARVRRQSLLFGVALVGAILLGIGGAILGAYTLWQAWRLAAWNFATRGLALLLIALLAWLAVAALAPVRGGDGSTSLSELARFGLARSTRGLKVVRLGLAGCAGAAVLGIAGTVIRTAAGRPPALSPVIDLIILALVALALALYGGRLRSDRARFAHLRHALRQP